MSWAANATGLFFDTSAPRSGAGGASTIRPLLAFARRFDSATSCFALSTSSTYAFQLATMSMKESIASRGRALAILHQVVCVHTKCGYAQRDTKSAGVTLIEMLIALFKI